jgi:excisionase family DNA binding protein
MALIIALFFMLRMVFAEHAGSSLLADIEGTCGELHVGRTKVFELIANGELESIVIGRRRLVPRASIEAYIERLRAEQRAKGAA